MWKSFYPAHSGIEPETFCNLDQLEKLEAARSAFLLLPLVTFPGLTRPYWALLCFTWPYLALHGLNGPYWALHGLTGPYWILLGHTGPYWALLVLKALLVINWALLSLNWALHMTFLIC